MDSRSPRYWRVLAWLQWRLLGIARRLPFFRSRPVPLIFPRASLHHLGTPAAWVYKEIFLDECYRWWRNTPLRSVVDLGGNIGLAALYFRTRYPESRVITVEANPEAARRLRGTTRHDPNIVVEEAAVAPSEGEVRMWIDQGSDAKLNSSLTGRDADKSDNFRTEMVKAKTLDSIVPDRVDFMKVDIEGMEYQILTAPCVHPDRIGAMVVEFHDLHKQRAQFESVRRELLRRGYHYLTEDPPEPWPSSRLVRFDAAA
jgi:FkbM family methyltransferase